MNDMTRIAQITQRVAQKFEVEKEAIDRGHLTEERYVAIYVGKESGYSAAAIARYFDVSDNTVYNAIKAIKDRMADDIALRIKVKNLLPKEPKTETNGQHLDGNTYQADDPVPEEVKVPAEKMLNVPEPVGPELEQDHHDLRPAGETLPDFDPNVEREAGPGPEHEPTMSAVDAALSRLTEEDMSSRLQRIKERLREKGVLPRENVIRSWDDTPVVKVGERELTIEVEDVGTITIPGHVALGSLKAVAIQRTAKILQALQDGRFRIDGA